MTLDITERQMNKLRLDAKTLVDVSRVLETDGRIPVLPGLLVGIASDILGAIDGESHSGKGVVT